MIVLLFTVVVSDDEDIFAQRRNKRRKVDTKKKKNVRETRQKLRRNVTQTGKGGDGAKAKNGNEADISDEDSNQEECFVYPFPSFNLAEEKNTNGGRLLTTFENIDSFITS